MKLHEVYDPITAKTLLESEGTFVGLNLSKKSCDQFCKWMKDIGVDKPLTPDDLHITLVLDRKSEFDWFDAEYDPELEIDPKTFKFEWFGEDKNVPVITFSNDELTRRHNAARDEHDIDWKFDNYCPHITLSYDGDNKELKSQTPDFPLYITGEYSEPFKD